MKESFLGKLLEHMDVLEPEEMRRYLLRLAEERGLLETIFNTLRDGVVVLTPEAKIEYYNHAASHLLGLPDDLSAGLGEKMSKYLKGLSWKNLLKQPQGSARDIEISYPEHRILQFYLVPGNLPGESIEGRQGEEAEKFVAIFHDITQREEATREAVESGRAEAITLLAAGVAHELGNPLNSLNIHLQLMERDAKRADKVTAERLMESIQIARGEISRLDTIIQQFLRAVRPTKPELAPVNMSFLVDDTIRVLQAELDDRDVLVEQQLSEDLPLVLADSEQLKQAFYNITKNAIQAMARGGILRVTGRVDGDWLAIDFVDNGPGIDPDTIPRVMDPYYTTKKRGTGLGLMIVHRIVTEIGGEMELESLKDQGTTVRLRFPLRNRPARLLPPKDEK